MEPTVTLTLSDYNQTKQLAEKYIEVVNKNLVFTEVRNMHNNTVETFFFESKDEAIDELIYKFAKENEEEYKRGYSNGLDVSTGLLSNYLRKIGL